MSKIKQFTLGAMFASLSLFSIDSVNAQKISKGVRNILLVHGAFADGSSYAKLIPILQGKGYNVIAVQNPLTSLEADVAATKRAIALADGPVLLVGHSYGGVVVTESGNDPKVAGLLYIAAVIPDEGQSLVDAAGKYPAAPGNIEMRKDASGFISLTETGIHKFFAQDLPAAERKVVYATQIPWYEGATTTKVTKAAWKSKPSWCIVAINDHMVNLELARAQVKRLNATALELQSSHVPMVSQPGKVAAFIVSAAEKL
ncbi:alpha/beta hydrolase [Terrimonas sp. NA20]|uniref:Alpha/beta hydrolase n=1 Tax=Terrimonas ginsenosidimutans TaxID=2908004 RepID=A0ABS9KTY8_9BACT|nr:alpha/beta hydrolase [Terrimonas ginsenosidimutans]MCG2615744.1 alpha/beta hydrolase [Terrimonas ginsenosidimutans]